MAENDDPRNVLIVGGTSGVGLATAHRFAADGDSVTIVGRDAARGESARTDLAGKYPGSEIRLVLGNANCPDEAERIVAESHAGFTGGVDLLVTATVGAALPDVFSEISIRDIPDALAGQVLGPILMARAVLPRMRSRRRGVIITIASDAGKVATPGETVIGAAMAAIMMFSRTLAMEVKRDGIRVNCVTPSLIKGTGTYDRIFEHPFSTRLFEKAARLASLGVAEADDIAALIQFLASTDASRLTGQTISVNGGISAH